MNVTGKEVNRWDASIHFENGTRTDVNGTVLQWPNWEPSAAPAATSLHQRRHFKEAPVLDVLGKEVNQWDASIHFENGTRTDANGTVLEWPNW